MAVIFPRWTNLLPLVLAAGLPLGAVGAIGGVWYWFSPSYTDVGYMPEQPIPYSHAVHAGKLGMDCRYCHDTVERAAHAAIPPTQTCMNCHGIVKKDSPKLELLRKSWETGEAIRWQKVHLLPDFVFFNHPIHVAAGVGCVECHGRIDQMEEVAQAKPLSMGWCLQCHRAPDLRLRPKDQVTNMEWNAASAGYDAAADPARTRKLQPPEHCSGCHR